MITSHILGGRLIQEKIVFILFPIFWSYTGKSKNRKQLKDDFTVSYAAFWKQEIKWKQKQFLKPNSPFLASWIQYNVYKSDNLSNNPMDNSSLAQGRTMFH